MHAAAALRDQLREAQAQVGMAAVWARGVVGGRRAGCYAVS